MSQEMNEELVIDANGTDFSEAEDQHPVTENVKSVVQIASTEDDVKYIMFSDELTGNTCPDEKIKLISIKDGTLIEIVAKGLRYLDSLPNKTKPILLIMAGNQDITPEEMQITENSIKGNEDQIKSHTIRTIMKKRQYLFEVIEERQGLVTVATLIPRPATQVYFTDNKSQVNQDKKHLAEFMQNLFCEINNQIIDMSKKHGMFTPNLKSTVEITGTHAGKRKNIRELNHKAGVKKTEVKRIKMDLYEKDRVNPIAKIKSKMMKMAKNNLLNGLKNRWNMGYNTRSKK